MIRIIHFILVYCHHACDRPIAAKSLTAQCDIIGSAGGAEKCDYVCEAFGFDHCVDYKTCTTKKDLIVALRKAAPEGIDMYFENVGGMHFEAAMSWSVNLILSFSPLFIFSSILSAVPCPLTSFTCEM